jgi:hypothetical protein
MVDTINISVILIAIIPFIFGLVALALIPSKDKILSHQVKTYRVEVLIVVYMIALFILMLGFYYFMSIFAEQSSGQTIRIFNGIFLEVVALGIMGLNYQSYSIFSNLELDKHIDDRIEAHEIGDSVASEVSPITIEPTISEGRKSEALQTQAEPEMLECPGCGNTITITVPKRPIKIQCPHCGVEGIIR